MRRSFSSQPLAIHGTSAEAVTALFERGVLPAESHECPTNARGVRDYATSFYFTPVSRNLRLSEYALPLCGYHTKTQAFSSARIYAQLFSWNHYVLGCLGYVPRWLQGAVDTPTNHRRWFEWEFKKKKGDVWVREFVDEMWNRRGFVIEPNEQLFESFSYQRGDDDPTTIAVRCPEGLPRECVQAVIPLGRREARLLRELVKALKGRRRYA